MRICRISIEKATNKLPSFILGNILVTNVNILLCIRPFSGVSPMTMVIIVAYGLPHNLHSVVVDISWLYSWL